MWNLLSYIRFPFSMIFFVLHTTILSTAMVVLSVFRSRYAEQYICWYWSRGVLRAFNVHTHVLGLKNMPPDGVLMLFHHTSWFDIWILLGSIWRVSRFGAKAELFKIPLFGTTMRVSGTLPIAREKRAEVLKVYKEAEVRFANGESFYLAPEGTRQSHPEIGPFKKGPFIFAVNAQVPIVPIVLYGAHTIMPKGSFFMGCGSWRTDVMVSILPAIATVGYSMENLEQLVSRVRTDMVAELSRLKSQK